MEIRTDSHQFDGEQNPDPHSSDADPQPSLRVMLFLPKPGGFCYCQNNPCQSLVFQMQICEPNDYKLFLWAR